MFRKYFIHYKFILLALLVLAIRLFAAHPRLVEQYYATGFYPPFSQAPRWLAGWIPFSVGDLLYAAAGLYLLYSVVGFVRKWRQGGVRKVLLINLLRNTLHWAMGIYILFQLFWGLNYSRLGIAAQLDLQVLPYTQRDLGILAGQLQARLAETAPLVDTIKRLALNKPQHLQAAGIAAYEAAKEKYPFLEYRAASIKPSLYSTFGHLVGFTGYYNPFTAEAQIKTDIPVFLKPFVVTHEMAHQLGYGRESEANFVAFLTCRESVNNEVRYAVYFELFLYTLSDMRNTDSAAARRYRDAAPAQVRRDLDALKVYLEQSRNPIEPYMARIYDAYLRWNNQPKGRLSYNEVVAWVVAYGKKYGRKAI